MCWEAEQGIQVYNIDVTYTVHFLTIPLLEGWTQASTVRCLQTQQTPNLWVYFFTYVPNNPLVARVSATKVGKKGGVLEERKLEARPPQAWFGRTGRLFGFLGWLGL